MTGRPLVNLSLALNQALGGTAVRGYHLVNLLLHALSSLTLFGLVRRTLRQTAPALEHLSTAVRLQPAYPEAHYNLGLALSKTGRVPEAIAAYTAALRLHPAYAEAHNNLGTARLLQGDRAAARRHYEAALRI